MRAEKGRSHSVQVGGASTCPEAAGPCPCQRWWDTPGRGAEVRGLLTKRRRLGLSWEQVEISEAELGMCGLAVITDSEKFQQNTDC